MARRKQSPEDCISRVRCMVADDGGTWDLSENDREALQHVLSEIERLESFKTAYDEWSRLTEWVQERKDWPFQYLGMYRARVMRKHIEHLEGEGGAP